MPLLHRNIKNIFNYSSICALFGQYFPFFIAGVQSWAGGGPQQVCAAVAGMQPLPCQGNVPGGPAQPSLGLGSPHRQWQAQPLVSFPLRSSWVVRFAFYPLWSQFLLFSNFTFPPWSAMFVSLSLGTDQRLGLFLYLPQVPGCINVCRGFFSQGTLLFPFWEGSLSITLCGEAAQTLDHL